MRSIAIVDSGPLLAVANRADPAHEACLAALSDPAFHLVVPALCVAEVSYFLQRKVGPRAEAKFLRGLEAFDVQAPMAEDWARIAALVEQYLSFPLGGVDASVIALAERMRSDLLITLDRRHFVTVRPAHVPRFRLLPAPE